MAKALVIRHASENSGDRINSWLNDNAIGQELVVPAIGDPLPNNLSRYDALVVYGGVQSANDGPDKPYIDEEIDLISNWAQAGRPVLGICLGAQMLSKALGGEVKRRSDRRFEIGFRQIAPTDESNGFLSRPGRFYQWHGEGFTIPQGAVHLAQSRDFPNQAFRYGHSAYGFQFHPEVTVQIMSGWIGHNEDRLDSLAGAHGRERQHADHDRYGADMHAWLESFLNRWKQAW